MIVAKDVPIVGGAMTVSGTYMPFTDETIMVTNASGVTSTDVFAAIVGAHGPITFDQSTLDLTAGSASETRPSIVQSGVNQEVIVIANTGAMVQFISSIAPSATTFTLDLGAALLPSISAPPVLDRASHRVTWQPTGGALTPDVTVARISITRGSTSWEWLVVGPYVAGELALPTLPVVGLDFNPKPGDDAGVSVLEQLHVPGGYDAARANALSVAVDFNVGGYFPIRIDPTAPGQATAAVFER